MQSSRKANSAPNKSSAREEKTSPASNRSTPKKTVKTSTQGLEFLVTGKQILRRNNRAYSLPGSSRRPSLDSLGVTTSSPRKTPSRDLTLDDVSLDLPQDSYVDCIQNQTFTTSTPKFYHQDSLKMHRICFKSQTSSVHDAEVQQKTSCQNRTSSPKDSEANGQGNKNAEDDFTSKTKAINSLKQGRASLQSNKRMKNKAEVFRNTKKNIECDALSDSAIQRCSLELQRTSTGSREVEENRKMNVEYLLTASTKNKPYLKQRRTSFGSHTSRRHYSEVNRNLKMDENVVDLTENARRKGSSKHHTGSAYSHTSSQDDEALIESLKKPKSDLLLKNYRGSNFQESRKSCFQNQSSGQYGAEEKRQQQKEVAADHLMSESMFSCSIEDSVYQTSSNASQVSRHRYYTSRSTDLDFSSASPEDSGQSSDGSTGLVSASSNSNLSHKPIDVDGEWHHFWNTYSSSKNVSVSQCLTELVKETQEPDPTAENVKPITPDSGTKTEGIMLTHSEVRNIIECTHIIGNVLTEAIGRSQIQQADAGSKL